MSGSDINFDVNGQPATGYLALPSQPDAPGVLVLHAWWGLNPFFKHVCDRLAAEGFAVFAPDLNGGRVAQTVDEAKQIMSELDEEWKYAIARSSLGVLRNRSEVRNEAFSLIGFSMGAAYSLILAGEQPQDVRKVVLFYGSAGPDSPKISAGLLGHYAEVDEWEPADDIRKFENDMRSAGLTPAFHFYPNARHWFFEEDRPEFNAEAAALAWTRTLEFLQAK